MSEVLNSNLIIIVNLFFTVLVVESRAAHRCSSGWW